MGPVGKAVVGCVISLGILASGLLLERQIKYRIFARAGIGGGWALTFFVTYALYRVPATHVISSQLVDLLLMMIVAVGMVWHSLRYKSQVVTSLAFLLAFLTVGISQVTLFSLVAGALLAAGLVYVAARESWFELGLAGLVGVYVNHSCGCSGCFRMEDSPAILSPSLWPVLDFNFCTGSSSAVLTCCGFRLQGVMRSWRRQQPFSTRSGSRAS